MANLSKTNLVAGIALLCVVGILAFVYFYKRRGGHETIVPPCVNCNNKFVGPDSHGYNDGPAKDPSAWESSCSDGLLDSCLYHTNPFDEEAQSICHQAVSSQCANSANNGVSPTY